MGNKILLTMIALAIASPAFATGIAKDTNPADCTSSVLGTTSGTSNLEASWSANILNLEWYNGNTQLDVQEGAETCAYDSGITVPSENPTREGYTFAGWRVRVSSNSETPEEPVAQCGLKGVDTSISGTTRSYISATGQCFNYDSEQSTWNTTDCSSAAVDGLEAGEWRVNFSYGTVEGQALCASNTGNYATAGIPDTSQAGRYCWCKATELVGTSCDYTPTWVYNGASSDPSFCRYECGRFCANFVQGHQDFRTGIYGQNAD